MKTILKLWRGEISEESLFNPAIKEKFKGKEFKENVIKEAEAFEKSLSEQQRKWSHSHWLVESEEWGEEVDWAFVGGFKIGARRMMDILEDRD